MSLIRRAKKWPICSACYSYLERISPLVQDGLVVIRCIACNSAYYYKEEEWKEATDGIEKPKGKR